MKIIARPGHKSNPLVPNSIPLWVGQKLRCHQCQTSVVLELLDAPAVSVLNPPMDSGRKPTFAIHCPHCGMVVVGTQETAHPPGPKIQDGAQGVGTIVNSAELQSIGGAKQWLRPVVPAEFRLTRPEKQESRDPMFYATR